MHKPLIVVASAAVLVAATVPVFGRKLGKPQKIERYGYSIRIIEDWTSIPAQPGETKIVGSWKPDQEEVDKRGDWAAWGCELTIVRFPGSGPTTGGTGSEAPAEEKKEPESEIDKIRARFGKSDPTNVEEYLDSVYEGARLRCTPTKVKAGSGKRRLTGELLEFTKGSSFVLAALFKEQDWEWGIFYEAPEDYYAREWKKLYDKSIESFRVFEAKGEPVYSVAADVDKSKLTETQKRDLIKAGIAGNPGWWAHDTENYVFLTNTTKKALVKQLAREIEVLRAKVYEKYFPPTKELDAICIVRVFADQSEYHQYGGPGGSAGYWSADKEELVLFDNFDNVSATKSKRYTQSVMYHEAFHQYIHYAVGDLAPHSWFNEGHGDFFAGAKIRGNGVKFDKFDWRVNTLKRHLALRKGLIPIQSLVRLPQREYYSNAGLKYAQGWALIYFLRNVTTKDEWEKVPDTYFEYLRDNIAAFKKNKAEKDDSSGESVEGIPGVKVYDFEDQEKVEQILREAVTKAFEGVDYAQLDEAYLRWIESL